LTGPGLGSGTGTTIARLRVYVGAVQSLAKFYEIPISLRYVHLPPAQPIYKKHPWTLAEVGLFIASMDKPMYKSIAASILQSGLSISDVLALTYGDIKEEFEKGVTPLCLDLTRRKTGVPFITFLGGWSVELLKDYLANRKLEDETSIYNVSVLTVHAYFRQEAQKFAGAFKGRNPYNPHSLRAAFRTFLSDHKVDPIVHRVLDGTQNPRTTKRLHKQKQRKLAPNMQRTSGTTSNATTIQKSHHLVATNRFFFVYARES